MSAATWAIDELDRVLGPDTIRAPRAEFVGGEWDYLNSLSSRAKRRLIGGRYLTAGGLAPDVAADIICDRVAECETLDSAMGWYVSMSRTAMAQKRRLAAKRQYKRRLDRAIAAGQDSVHYHRLFLSLGIGEAA